MHFAVHNYYVYCGGGHFKERAQDDRVLDCLLRPEMSFNRFHDHVLMLEVRTVIAQMIHVTLLHRPVNFIIQNPILYQTQRGFASYRLCIAAQFSTGF